MNINWKKLEDAEQKLAAAEEAAGASRCVARMEQREASKIENYGPWHIQGMWPAGPGFDAVWFTDPDEPTRVEVVAWGACVRRIRSTPAGLGLRFSYVRDERAALPIVVCGGKLQLCDDADAVLGPNQNIEEQLGVPPVDL